MNRKYFFRRVGWSAALLLFASAQIAAADVPQIQTTGAPSPRQYHSTVFTGAEMIVWGGDSSWPDKNAGNTNDAQNARVPLGDGGRYSPGDNQWLPLTQVGAPTARFGHTAVWTGHEMIIWGGEIDKEAMQTGGRYDVKTRSWTSMTTRGAPSARSGHVAVWTGSEMIVWGGSSAEFFFNDGAAYDPDQNVWRELPSRGSPSSRIDAAGIWTGSALLIWGGQGTSGPLGDGAVYSPTSRRWIALPTANSPSPRVAPWVFATGDSVIVVGGYELESHSSYVSPRHLLDIFLLNTQSLEWTSLPEISCPKSILGAAMLNDDLILYGDVKRYFTGDGSYSRCSNAEALSYVAVRYDLSDSSWREIGSNYLGGGFTVVASEDEVYVWGGHDGTNLYNEGFRIPVQQ